MDINTNGNSVSYNACNTITGQTWNSVIVCGGGGSSQTTPNLNQVLIQVNDAGAKQIKNLADPTANQDAATKKYVDSKYLPGTIAGACTINGGIWPVTSCNSYDITSCASGWTLAYVGAVTSVYSRFCVKI